MPELKSSEFPLMYPADMTTTKAAANDIIENFDLKFYTNTTWDRYFLYRSFISSYRFTQLELRITEALRQRKFLYASIDAQLSSSTEIALKSYPGRLSVNFRDRHRESFLKKTNIIFPAYTRWRSRVLEDSRIRVKESFFLNWTENRLQRIHRWLHFISIGIRLTQNKISLLVYMI